MGANRTGDGRRQSCSQCCAMICTSIFGGRPGFWSPQRVREERVCSSRFLSCVLEDKGIGLACPPLDNRVEQALESLSRRAGKAVSSLSVGRPGRGGVLSSSGQYTTGSGMNPSPASQNDKEIRERWTGVAGVYVSGWMSCGRRARYLLLRLLPMAALGTDPGLPADFQAGRTRAYRYDVRLPAW